MGRAKEEAEDDVVQSSVPLLLSLSQAGSDVDVCRLHDICVMAIWMEDDDIRLVVIATTALCVQDRIIAGPS